MKLIDLDAKIIITVTDETKGGMVYEEQMTLAEFFSKCVPDYRPEIVDAIPVEWCNWLSQKSRGSGLFIYNNDTLYALGAFILRAWNATKEVWQEEQEAEK